jgi:hypothetical protein
MKMGKVLKDSIVKYGDKLDLPLRVAGVITAGVGTVLSGYRYDIWGPIGYTMVALGDVAGGLKTFFEEEYDRGVGIELASRFGRAGANLLVAYILSPPTAAGPHPNLDSYAVGGSIGANGILEGVGRYGRYISERISPRKRSARKALEISSDIRKGKIVPIEDVQRKLEGLKKELDKLNP